MIYLGSFDGTESERLVERLKEVLLAASRAADAAESPRQCVRCHADVHAPDGPHLCKDVVGRLHAQERRLKAAIRKVIWESDHERVAAKLGEAYAQTVTQLVDEIFAGFMKAVADE